MSFITSSLRGRCNLYLDEEISILEYKDTMNLLNETKEFIDKCRHSNKYLIWHRIILASNHNKQNHNSFYNM